MTGKRAESNLTFWRGLVGLDPSFPDLTPLSDEELLKMVVTDEAQMEAIGSSVASQQLNLILVEPGWGAHTLFRYLVHDARDHAMDRLTLPIALDFETMFRRVDITPETLTYEIRRQLMSLLVGNPWEQSQNRDFYYECINYDGERALGVYKAEANTFLNLQRPPKESDMLRRFPWLRGPLSVHTTYLLNKMRIQTALLVHLPRTMSAQRIQDFVASVKWVTQQKSDLQYAAWREIYVGATAIKAEVNRDFKRAWNVVEYQKYTSAQIYKMLIQRYQPSLSAIGGQRRLSLTEVFAAEFVDEAWRDADSLEDLSHRVRRAVLERLNCPPSAVRFRLEPQTEATVEEEQPQADSLATRLAAKRRAAEESRGSGR